MIRVCRVMTPDRCGVGNTKGNAAMRLTRPAEDPSRSPMEKAVDDSLDPGGLVIFCRATGSSRTLTSLAQHVEGGRHARTTSVSRRRPAAAGPRERTLPSLGHAPGRLMLGLGIALGSILLALGVVELVGRFILTPLMLEYSDNQALKLQLASPKDLGVASLYTPHHYSLYALRPSYRSSDRKTRHNSRGCRAEEFRVPKPPGVYRIIALGGSTTYSTSVRDNGDVFTYRLQALLNAPTSRLAKAQSFEVINCGVPGFTSAETLVRYIFVVSEHQPDLLIVQQGLNDVLPRSLPTVSRDYREFSKTWAWEGIEVNGDRWFLGRLLQAARTAVPTSRQVSALTIKVGPLGTV